MTYPSGTHVVFTAPGSATSGQYGLFEWNIGGGWTGASTNRGRARLAVVSGWSG